MGKVTAHAGPLLIGLQRGACGARALIVEHEAFMRKVANLVETTGRRLKEKPKESLSGTRKGTLPESFRGLSSAAQIHCPAGSR